MLVSLWSSLDTSATICLCLSFLTEICCWWIDEAEGVDVCKAITLW